MAVVAVADFIDTLRKSRLLEPEQLDELCHTLQPRCGDARGLARELLTRDWLTPYQVNQLFQERGQELVLGQYVLLERLGEGGMGKVFKARHRSLGRIVALKIIRKERLIRPEVVLRFHREVQAAAQLKHPNVVLAFDADQIGDTHFIAMEYVEGIDLSHLVKTTGPLPVEQACDYITQAALGLQHAHERGLVHRDIKPANLLVTRLPSVATPVPASDTMPQLVALAPQGTSLAGVAKKPQVKILDMGLARLQPSMQEEKGTAVTQEGTVIGTVDYLAPEQAANASNVDIRADIYSLGCTFYYLLTGQVPFAGSTAMEKLLKHRAEEPPPVEHVRPEVSPSLAVVVRKLMAKCPEDRYQTPADVVLALTTLVSKGGLARTLAIPAGSGPEIPQAIPVLAAGSPLPVVARAVKASPIQEVVSPWAQLTAQSLSEATLPQARPVVQTRAPSRLLQVGIAAAVVLAGLVFLILLLFRPG